MPRDERFSEIKQSLFHSEKRNKTFEHRSGNFEHGFPNFTEIDKLFNEFRDLPQLLDSTSIAILILLSFDNLNSTHEY